MGENNKERNFIVSMAITGDVLWSARVSGSPPFIFEGVSYMYKLCHLDKAKKSYLVRTLNSLISKAVKLTILI